MGKRNLDSMTSTSKAPKAAELPDDPEAQEPMGWRATFNTEANFDPGELSTAYLTLAQALSQDVKDRRAREGQMLVTGMAPVDSVILVVAGHVKNRRLLGDNMKTRCWSPDAVLGVGDPGTLKSGQPAAEDADHYELGRDGLYHLKCAACPFAQWVDTGRKRADGSTINQKPPCNEIDSFLCYSVTHGMPVIWNLKASGAKAARFIKTLATGLGFGNFAIEVSGEIETNTQGATYMIPKVVLANEGFAPEELAAYAAMARGTQQTAGAIVAGA